MTKSEKQEFWQDHLSGWKASGLSQADYCQKHGLKPTRFSYWRSKQNKAGRKLMPLDLGLTGPGIGLTLPGGIHMDIPVAQLEQVLPMVLRLMRERD